MGSRALAAAAAAALCLSPVRAPAQVQAPTLVEGELQPEPARDVDRPAARPGEPIPEPPPAPEPAPPPRSVQADPQPQAGQARGTPPGVSIGGEELKRLQRAIVPVGISVARIGEIWQARRAAVREQDAAKARAAAVALRDAQRELGILGLEGHAAVEIRDAARSMESRAVEEALGHAELAVALAPDIPDPHLALARVRLAADPTRPLPAISAAADAVRAAAREPRLARAFVGDVAAAGVAALFAAAAATVVLLFLSRVRLFVHDVRHLPVLRAGTSGQATVVALALLVLPLVFGLGAFAVLFLAALAAWPYLVRRERATVLVALLAMAALPWLAYQGARAATWQGTLADEVHAIEHGFPAPERVAALEERAGRERLPAAALQALGRWRKRLGDLPAARRWYEAALAAEPRSADLQVNLGNVLFLQGDLEAAKEAYLAAADRSTGLATLAAAHYDLSKLYLRLSAVGQSSDARRRAEQEDPGYLARHGSDDDFRANTWLVDAVLPAERIAALARGDAGAAEVSGAVLRFLSGPFPARGWPLGPIAALVALSLLSLLVPRLEPSRACERCGRPACRRCDGATGAACGQCVTVFYKQNAVEPRDRARKEVRVRQYTRWRRAAVRALAIVGGGAGQIATGRAPAGMAAIFGLAFLGALALFWHGLLPMPRYSGFAVGLRLAVAVPALLALYVLVVRDAFRRSGEGS